MLSIFTIHNNCMITFMFTQRAIIHIVFTACLPVCLHCYHCVDIVLFFSFTRDYNNNKFTIWDVSLCGIN